MLKLPNVTLIALTNQPEKHFKAFEESRKDIEWGDAKLIVDYNCTSIEIWNWKIIFELHNYVTTSHAMLIHHDGYVINPSLWNPTWMMWDFIGAPWPYPKDSYSYRDPFGNIQRVGNSVSLRSKKLMELPSQLKMPWGNYYGNSNEDGYLTVHHRRMLENHGCNFAPLEVAKYFSKEHSIPENEGIETFAFHTVDK